MSWMGRVAIVVAGCCVLLIAVVIIVSYLEGWRWRRK